MTQKVRLPREVAEALERAKSEFTDAQFIARCIANVNWAMENGGFWLTLYEYGKFFDLIDALRYGYEIEPEPITVTVTAKQIDHIRLVYSYDADLPSSHTRSYSDGVRFGVRRTLDHLGVEIPGVNAPATSSTKSG